MRRDVRFFFFSPFLNFFAFDSLHPCRSVFVSMGESFAPARISDLLTGEQASACLALPTPLPITSILDQLFSLTPSLRCRPTHSLSPLFFRF